MVDQNTKEDDQELAGVWKLRHSRESFGNDEDHGKDWIESRFDFYLCTFADCLGSIAHVTWLGCWAVGKAVWSCIRCFWEYFMKLKANTLSLWL